MSTTHECLAAIQALTRAARAMIPIIHDDQSPSPEAIALADSLDDAVLIGERVLRAAQENHASQVAELVQNHLDAQAVLGDLRPRSWARPLAQKAVDRAHAAHLDALRASTLWQNPPPQ